jgi:hypothetical protein
MLADQVEHAGVAEGLAQGALEAGEHEGDPLLAQQRLQDPDGNDPGHGDGRDGDPTTDDSAGRHRSRITRIR